MEFLPSILVLKPVFQECFFVSVYLEKPTGISIVNLILGHLSAAVVREVYRLLFSVSSRLKNAAFVSRMLTILANSQLSAKRHSDLTSRTGVRHFISKKIFLSIICWGTLLFLTFAKNKIMVL